MYHYLLPSRLCCVPCILLFQETEDQMSVKSKIIKEYTEVVDKIIATAPTGTEPPVVSKDLEIAAKKYHSTLTEIQ